MDDTLIKVEDLCKIYNPGENEVWALDHVSLEIKKGELVAIIGQSGSGKSTFMNMLGCLDVPTSGKYYLNGTDVSEMSDKKFVKHPLDVVSVGDIVDVKVMGVDLKKQRIQLTMKL